MNRGNLNRARSGQLDGPGGVSFGLVASCPAFSVLGTDTAPLFAEAHRRLHEWFPSCVDAVLPGVTYLLPMEATEAVADAMGEFLRSASTVVTVPNPNGRFLG